MSTPTAHPGPAHTLHNPLAVTQLPWALQSFPRNPTRGCCSPPILTLKCQRVRTAMTMAVVVLPRPLEQLNTKAARESSARALFMASSSRSKSCQDEASGFLGMQDFLTLGSPLSYSLQVEIPVSLMPDPCPPEGTQPLHAASPGHPPCPGQAPHQH